MSKKTLGLVGLLLIAGGVLALIFEGISYTSRETVIDMGPVTVEADTPREVTIPPFLSGVALAGGIALLMVSRKKS